jgi:hypothetical protein
VLPPWGQLYHWQSADAGKQDMLPWGLFFDVMSLQKFAPVMEMQQFLQGMARVYSLSRMCTTLENMKLIEGHFKLYIH